MTLFFSCSTPNLAKVIPAMDFIDAHLATASLDNRYSPSIQAALAVGKNLLNKYYNMTDHSELFRIAMVMSLHTFYHLLVVNIYCNMHSSSSPESQAQLFQECIMG